MVSEASDDTTRLHWILLGLLVGTFTVLATCLASWKAASLMPEWGFDLSFFHNLVWNVSEGNGYRQSSSYHEPPGIFNESHFEPIIVLAAPLYKLVPRLETVFAVQSALLGLGALGIFRIARSAGASAWAALGGATIYLFWWPLWRMAMADIRPLLWCIPFLILLVAALRENRRREALIWAGLACLCREEVPVLVFFTALGALLWRVGDRRERRNTVLLLAGGVALFSVATWFLRREGAPTFYIRPLDWLKTFFGAPDVDGQMSNYGHSASELLGLRLAYLREWLLPAALGVLLAPEVLLASAPLFLYLFTQSDEWASWEGSYVH
ncbi:MAG: DUF2079 domain-containing protein, partial [Myxococcota bacterium]|nr:DUF2079 domain-containing protein [Myxococcota bacterium]